MPRELRKKHIFLSLKLRAQAINIVEDEEEACTRMHIMENYFENVRQ